MSGGYEIEMEQWLKELPDKAYGQALFYRDLLASRGPSLGFPYAGHLKGKVWESRPAILGVETRITYWLTSERRAVLLTVFNKTRRSEQKQIDRAVRAQETCEAEHHGHAEKIYDREPR
ncbi:type II toxin-antitoxin system RelE/ParE family toxin [Actinocorallia sp. B10E7]|uniref:type II toxin-antitoxin system RelE/ParE family toxin n=1 Tax=Actinocorallia sp. B10E7 TaxID=3153558 RepID=UPI00325F78AE